MCCQVLNNRDKNTLDETLPFETLLKPKTNAHQTEITKQQRGTVIKSRWKWKRVHSKKK